jgi:hypothetical protein
MATPDATTALLRSLNDESKWETVDRVSVFKPHTAVGDDGKPYTVTAEDLNLIAQNTNRAYRENGHPVRLTVGHLNPKSKTAEQAPLVGFAINYQAQMVERPDGPQLRLTHTEKVRREMSDWWRLFPYRSAEYNRHAKIIRGCAGIIETPRLELGAVTNYADDESVTSLVHYSTGEIAVPDDMQQATTQPSADSDMSALAAKVAELLKPAIAQMVKDAMAAGGSSKTEPDGDETLNSSRANEQQYAALNAELAKVKTDLEIEKKARDRQTCERIVDTIEGHYSFDRNEEVAYMMSLPSLDARTKRIDYLRKHLRPLPTGSMVRVANPERPTTANTDAPLTEEETYAAKQYKTKNSGVTWEQAYTHVKSMRKS